LVKHYHQRWEIEIAFDEIKTHQCARLRGQMPTIFRSQRPDLVKQELYSQSHTRKTPSKSREKSSQNHKLIPLAMP
jgi:hypothetical protein